MQLIFGGKEIPKYQSHTILFLLVSIHYVRVMLGHHNILYKQN